MVVNKKNIKQSLFELGIQAVPWHSFWVYSTVSLFYRQLTCHYIVQV